VVVLPDRIVLPDGLTFNRRPALAYKLRFGKRNFERLRDERSGPLGPDVELERLMSPSR
jgi:hypothetical protein